MGFKRYQMNTQHKKKKKSEQHRDLKIDFGFLLFDIKFWQQKRKKNCVGLRLSLLQSQKSPCYVAFIDFFEFCHHRESERAQEKKKMVFTEYIISTS